MNGTFIYFVAEVAALDKPPAPEAAARAPASAHFLRLVKEYWPQVLFLVGSVAAVADRIINSKP